MSNGKANNNPNTTSKSHVQPKILMKQEPEMRFILSDSDEDTPLIKIETSKFPNGNSITKTAFRDQILPYNDSEDEDYDFKGEEEEEYEVLEWQDGDTDSLKANSRVQNDVERRTDLVELVSSDDDDVDVEKWGNSKPATTGRNSHSDYTFSKPSMPSNTTSMSSVFVPLVSSAPPLLDNAVAVKRTSPSKQTSNFPTYSTSKPAYHTPDRLISPVRLQAVDQSTVSLLPKSLDSAAFSSTTSSPSRQIFPYEVAVSLWQAHNYSWIKDMESLELAQLELSEKIPSDRLKFEEYQDSAKENDNTTKDYESTSIITSTA